MNMQAKSLLIDASDDTLSRPNFDRLTQLIKDGSGIEIAASKRTMLEARLRRRARSLGTMRLDEYCRLLFEEDRLVDEYPHLINAVTTNKTDFFREPAHFELLTQHFLPEFWERSERPVRVWSAACSTGAEPYTLAMVLDAFAAAIGGPRYGILATDIDTDVLETAKRAIYSRSMVDPVPPALRAQYIMEPRDPARNEVRINTALRATVGFARLNLMDSAYHVGDPMDVIFCRNVLIYFNKEAQKQVVSRLVDNLAPGGWLVLGHSEGAAAADPRISLISNTIYRRT